MINGEFTEDEAISRLTNLAQEKNKNWLGATNISAMQKVLEIVKRNSLNREDIEIIERLKKLVSKCDNCEWIKIGNCLNCIVDYETIQDIKK